MIGRVNAMRVAFGKRIRARTNTKAAIVPMIVARIATIAATVIELPTARIRTRLLSIASYQWSVKPVIGRPGVAPSSKEKTIMKMTGR